MTTVRDIIRGAYRKIGVLASGENLPADHAVDGLFAFNNMLHQFKTRNADITHTDVTLNDAAPMPDEFTEGCVYMLAARLSPDFMFPANFDADDWFRTVQARYGVIPTLTIPDALVRPPSREAREGNLPLTET